MPEIFEVVQPIIKPTIDIPENIAPNLGDKRIGQRIKAIVDYQVIEKTKSFVVLRISYFLITPSKRVL